MGEWIELTAADGHRFAAYRVEPPATPRAGLVIAQEIFGVNDHMQDVADGFAAEGYRVLTPALFDRIERNVSVDYDAAGMARGRALRGQLSWDQVMADISAAIAALDTAKAGLVGYCWGGSIAWMAAATCAIDAAVGYYGGQIYEERHRTPTCPIMLHFGAEDGAIPLDQVEAVKDAHPDVPLFVYDGAGHGFNCDRRGSFHAAAAEQARGRTLDFLATHLG